MYSCNSRDLVSQTEHMLFHDAENLIVHDQGRAKDEDDDAHREEKHPPLDRQAGVQPLNEMFHRLALLFIDGIVFHVIPVEVTMFNIHVAILLLQMISKLFRNEYRTVHAARTSYGDCKLRLAGFLELLDHEIHEIIELRQEFSRDRRCADVVSDFLHASCPVLVLLHIERIRQETDIKHRVRINRNPVFETEGKTAICISFL